LKAGMNGKAKKELKAGMNGKAEKELKAGMNDKKELKAGMNGKAKKVIHKMFKKRPHKFTQSFSVSNEEQQ
jgi:hypothetical protein